jgi:hypothetical protein
MKYKGQLLDHFIEAALDAIKRGRATWLLGIIIVFVFGVAIFNATFSWNDEQIKRRANIWGVAVKGYADVEALTKHDASINDPLNNGIAELGYLQPLWETAKNKHEAFERFTIPDDASDDADQKTKDEVKKKRAEAIETKSRLEKEANDAMNELKSAAFSDLNAHIARRNAFDTVGIPFLGVSVTGSDYGIIGGIALIIVGYWLLAMLRRELLVLSEFVRIGNDRHLEKGFFHFESSELIYACQRIKHYMVFSIPEPGSWLTYVTTASFFAAPILLILNHFLSVKDLYGKHLGDYGPHFMLEGLVMIIGTAVWVKGFLYQYRSMQLMQLWEIECRKENPFQSK